MNEAVETILNKVVQHTQCHPICVEKLLKQKNTLSPREFSNNFNSLLFNVLSQSKEHDLLVKKASIFIALFCKKLMRNDDVNSEQFVMAFIDRVLYFCNRDVDQVRFYACRLIKIILGEFVQIQIDYELCDKIQSVLIDRLLDPKMEVRIEAIEAVGRLQSPDTAGNCPAVNALIKLLNDRKPKIRKETLRVVAIVRQGWDQIKNRLRDIDKSVRLTAFNRIGKVNSQKLSISSRKEILQIAFSERDSDIQKCFHADFLPKWLLVYDNKFLIFLNSVRLVESKDDCREYRTLTKNLVNYFYKNYPVNSIISEIGLSKDKKLIEVADLNLANVLFWYHSVVYFRKDAELECYLGEVLPELTEFIAYLTCVIDIKTNENLDGMAKVEFEFILEILLEIAKDFDFSDEYGRKSFKSLIETMLKTFQFDIAITKILMQIARKCASNTNNLIDLVYDIMTELRAQDQSQQSNQLNAASVYSLNLLISLLSLKEINSLTPKLETIKSEFVLPILSEGNNHLCAQLMHTMSLFAVIDRATAEEFGPIIRMPALSSDQFAFDAATITCSIAGICDLLRMYGVDFVCGEESEEESINKSDLNELLAKPSLDQVYDMLLSNFDSNVNDIRYEAANSMFSIVDHNKIPTPPKILATLILKWFNPNLEKTDIKLSMIIGEMFSSYSSNPASKPVFVKAVLLIYEKIIYGRKDLYRFISLDKITTFCIYWAEGSKESELHTLALDIIYRIGENVSDAAVPYLFRILQHFSTGFKDKVIIAELIEKGEELLEDVTARMLRKRLLSILQNLKMIAENAQNE